MASEETELKEQLEVASQLLDDSVNPWRITCSQRKGVIDSLQEQTEESSEEHLEEPEAKSSSESETYEGLRNLFLTLPEPEPEMSTSGAAAPDVKPKEETTDEDWATMIATSVIDAMTNKKNETDKTLLPDKWKIMEQLKMFPEDDDNVEKRKIAEETWSSFKSRFQATWQPINVAREAQMKIKDLRMKNRVDNYVHDFQLLALETGYYDKVLIKIFREGLPTSLQDKLMLRLEGAPTTIDEWYQLAIQYDNQYKFVMATKKRRVPKEPIKLKIVQKEKEVVIS
ncbi:hypothetical protein WG66_007432 [Moniliophthora roreri]|nr:hypothetical protein WG66_007432 [Moniliophthora roreri]